jgi:hypothetical protein
MCEKINPQKIAALARSAENFACMLTCLINVGGLIIVATLTFLESADYRELHNNEPADLCTQQRHFFDRNEFASSVVEWLREERRLPAQQARAVPVLPMIAAMMVRPNTPATRL